MSVRMVGLVVLLWLPLQAFGQGTPNPAKTPPNIVVVLMDDLRWDELGCTGHPFVKTPHIDRLAKEGMRFRNAFMTTPLCSPSRASFLTGQYAHTHGILDNTDRSVASHKLTTFPMLLKGAGYETAFIGKWHMGRDASPRPGFDRWVSFSGQGTYRNPTLNVDGKTVKTKGYVTDILNEHAVNFIKQPHKKPFLVYLPHKAVHPEITQNYSGRVKVPDSERFIPAERHRKMYAHDPIPRRPNFGVEPKGKPALQRKLGNLGPLGKKTVTSDDVVRGRLRTLMAVEDAVGQIFTALKQTGQLDNTIFIFTSDNGYFYGEHGLSEERRLAYEESIRMPLLVRYPPMIKAAGVRDEFVLNIDLAPTLLELAGVAVPKTMQGQSMVPLLKGEKPAWRNSLLLEYFTEGNFPRIHKMAYKAVRTQNGKYIRYLELDGMDELYDLKADPYEMKNIIKTPGSEKLLEETKKELERLLKETGGG